MVALVIAYLLNIIDYLLTLNWVCMYGTEIEANPIMRWAFENNMAGFIKIGVVGVLFAAIGSAIQHNRKMEMAAYTLLLVFSMILVYHIVLMCIV